MYVALSSDSTCTNDLKSAKEGYETLVLTSIPPPPLPFEVKIRTKSYKLCFSSLKRKVLKINKISLLR